MMTVSMPMSTLVWLIVNVDFVTQEARSKMRVIFISP